MRKRKSQEIARGNDPFFSRLQSSSIPSSVVKVRLVNLVKPELPKDTLDPTGFGSQVQSENFKMSFFDFLNFRKLKKNAAQTNKQTNKEKKSFYRRL